MAKSTKKKYINDSPFWYQQKCVDELCSTLFFNPRGENLANFPLEKAVLFFKKFLQ